MKPLLCLAVAAQIAAAVAQEPALKEHPLPAIKASLLLPDGWFIKEENDDGVIVYQISREKAENAGDTFSAGLILTVTTKLPERAAMKPSEYAADLLSSTQEDGTELQKTTDGPFQGFRAAYKIESDQGAIQIVNLAKANDATGTLYFLTWQSPDSEDKELRDIREKIFSSLKLDPGF